MALNICPRENEYLRSLDTVLFQLHFLYHRKR